MIPHLSPQLTALLLLYVGLLAMTEIWIICKPLRRQNRLQRRLVEIRVKEALADGRSHDAAAPFLFVAKLGSLLTRTGIVSAKSLATLRSTVLAAGMRSDKILPMFIGAKTLLLVIVPLVTWAVLNHLGVAPTTSHLIVAASAVIGLLAPDFIIRNIRKRYLASVERAIPDALDLLIICTEAGLALEQGMERVAAEMRISSAPCSTELSMTRDELRILSDRRQALINLGQRTGLVSLQRLGGTLAQALKYGTPLGQALRTLAAELRADALTRFEERAGRLPVLMTVPMILFILPCVFLVVAGPAALSLRHLLSH